MEEVIVNEVIEEQKKKKLPAFLKVLCILSFVGIGLSVTMSLNSSFKIESEVDQLMQAQAQLENSGINFGSFDSYAANLQQWGVLTYSYNIFAALILLLGVLLMWNLKKIGYYIYVVFEITPLILTIIFLGFGNMFSLIGYFFSFMVSLAFIIMYGVNLKHMS